jgi:type IV pilus assembly protein PilM
VLIDIGASTTNVVITSSGVPQFVRMIPAGGEDITRALINALELSPQQAEAFKRSRGLAPAASLPENERRAADVVRESASELLSSLRNTLNYYSNTRQNDPIQGILLSGGGSRLAGLAQTLAEMTRISVVPANPFGSVEMSKALRRQSATDELAMTVSLGLAIGSAA